MRNVTQKTATKNRKNFRAAAAAVHALKSGNSIELWPRAHQPRRQKTIRSRDNRTEKRAKDGKMIAQERMRTHRTKRHRQKSHFDSHLILKIDC